MNAQITPDEEKATPVELPAVTENNKKPNTSNNIALFPSSLDPSRVEQIQTYIRDNQHADDVLSHVFGATEEVIYTWLRQDNGLLVWPCLWLHVFFGAPCLIATRNAAEAEKKGTTFALSSKHNHVYRYLDPDVVQPKGCLADCFDPGAFKAGRVKSGHVNIADIRDIKHFKGNENGGCSALGCPMPDQIVREGIVDRGIKCDSVCRRLHQRKEEEVGRQSRGKTTCERKVKRAETVAEDRETYSPPPSVLRARQNPQVHVQSADDLGKCQAGLPGEARLGENTNRLITSQHEARPRTKGSTYCENNNRKFNKSTKTYAPSRGSPIGKDKHSKIATMIPQVLTIPADSELAPPSNQSHRDQQRGVAPKDQELWLLLDPADIDEVLSALQGMKRKFVASKAESGDVAAGDGGNAAALQAPAQQSMYDPAEQIRKLQAMKDEGLLTEEEFAEKKKQIIANM